MLRLRSCLLFTFSMLAGLSAFAQKTTISGYISDSASGEAIPGAVIYIPELKTGAVANVNGFYSLGIPRRGTYLLRVSYVGFRPRFDTLYLENEFTFNPKLEILTSREVTVTAQGPEGPVYEEVERTDFNMEQLEQLPRELGEVDVMRSLQLLPGIQKNDDGGAGIYVRGGGPDQNLVLLDGVPVYNTIHLFGFVPTFNADAISSVQLYKGGFPARFGGRLSSVVDIATKEGNDKQFKGLVSIGPVIGRLSLEGPLYRDKTSFSLSMRRTFLDVFTNALLAGSGVELGFFFNDINARINHKFGQKDQLSFSIYGGRDKFYIGSTDTTMVSPGAYIAERYYSSLYWGNLSSSLRYTHVFHSRFFNNTSLFYSRYRFHNGNIYERTQLLGASNITEKLDLTYFSGIQDAGIKTDFEYIPQPKRHIRFGAVYTNHTFNPGTINAIITSPGTTQDTTIQPQGNTMSHEMAGYLESEESLSPIFKVNVGLRLSALANSGKFYFNPEPRLSMRLLPDDHSTIRLSYARMAQYVQLLANSGTSLPIDLWVPATAKVKPQTSQQVAVGYSRHLPKAWEFNVEAYYKWLNNVIDYKEGGLFGDVNAHWEDQVVSGKGRTYGVEFLLRKKVGKYSGWLGYTLSWSKRQFAEINEGREFPYKYDRRHDVSAVLSRQLGSKSNIMMAYVFSTGPALTMPVGQYPDVNGNIVYYYGEKNNFRMRNYSRLDFTVNAMIDETERLEHYFTLSLYNMLFRQNPFYVFVYDDNGKKDIIQVSLLPFAIPSVTYGIKF